MILAQKKPAAIVYVLCSCLQMYTTTTLLSKELDLVKGDFGVIETALRILEKADHSRYWMCTSVCDQNSNKKFSGSHSDIVFRLLFCLHILCPCVLQDYVKCCIKCGWLFTCFFISLFSRISCMCSPPPFRLPGQVMPFILSCSTGENWTGPRSNPWV